MKKTTHLLSALTLFVLLFVNTNVTNAQTSPSHIYHVNTWYMVTGLDSMARAERDVVLKEYLTKVTMKNELVIHQTMMTHFFTEDSREFVTITEYANFGDIEKAFDRDGQLEKQAWPDEQKRKDFMKKMNSYFTYHKDAIYHGMPSLMK